jgi:hypothetical protein
VATTQNKMKKTLLNLVLICSVAIFFTSCVTTNKGFQSSPVISRNVQLDPIKADIKVNETEKISGESISTYFLFFRISGDNTFADGINYSTDAGGSGLRLYNPMKKARLNKVRSAAAYKALSTVDYDFGEYDFLVHPNYTMTTKNYLGIVKVYECKVSGYGAKYKNFRTEKQKIVILEDSKELILQDK